MPDHHLTNPRTVNRIPDGTRNPICYQCRYPLADVKQLSGIVTGTGNRRYCNETCYDDYIKARAAQDVIDFVASDRYRPYVPTWQRGPTAESARPEHTAPAFRPDPDFARQVAAHRRQATKSNVRKTGEAAANVVGFVIWLCVISAIAALLFAACGIQSL